MAAESKESESTTNANVEVLDTTDVYHGALIVKNSAAFELSAVA
jgi:hypothetical protein